MEAASASRGRPMGQLDGECSGSQDTTVLDPPVLDQAVPRRLWPLLVAILLVAALARLFRLASVPPPLADEVIAAVDTRALIQKGEHFTGTPVSLLGRLTPILDGRYIALWLGGPSVEALRVIAAAFGVGTVALTSPLAHELRMPKRVGLVAAASLAVMPWHVYFSRIFFPASEYLFMTVLAAVTLLAALRKRSLSLGICSACAAAVSIYLYPVAFVTTPVLLGAVVVSRWRDVRSFGFLKALIICEVGLYLLFPYVIAHAQTADPLVANINGVINSKLLWNQGYPGTKALYQFLGNWASYFSPKFLFFRGDPNVAQSTQRVGQVGWAVAALGCAGLVAGLIRRRPGDKLLLAWTVLFPLGDAITSVDAVGNGVRGITGSMVWALWAGVGLLVLTERRHYSRSLLGVGAAAALLVQTVTFARYYFGPYGKDYGYAFEVGFDDVYPILAQRGLTPVPLIFHGGYQRDVILEYFSNYQLKPRSAVLSCHDLPYTTLEDMEPPVILVTRDDPSVTGLAGCVPGRVVQRDTTKLKSLAEIDREALWRVELVADFAHDTHGHRTAIFYVSGTSPGATTDPSAP